jgi:hypothetical protein
VPTIACIVLLITGCSLLGQTKAPVALHSPVQDKNFYLLSKLESSSVVRLALDSDASLKRIGQAKREALTQSVKSCGTDLDCNLTALKWTPVEISQAGEALRDLARRNRNLKQLVAGPLRRSGIFQCYASRSDEELLALAWSDAARAINNIIDVYGAGKPPRYPQIDSITYDVKSDSYRRTIQMAIAVLLEQSSDRTPFFQLPLKFALYLLDANGRDEAARLEPLESGENAAAIRWIATIAWNKFPYTVILVPGSGSDRTTISMSPVGKLRLILAAKRFRDGKAPIIVVSGGFVHPSQTPFCEAIEMKKYLIANLNIPANAILVDPHARHTTTNIRNAARQMYRYGIPFDKPALVTTDQFQSASIESPGFAERCRRELGYLPYQLKHRLSQFDLEFLPTLEALHADAMDPLDP